MEKGRRENRVPYRELIDLEMDKIQLLVVSYSLLNDSHFVFHFSLVARSRRHNGMLVKQRNVFSDALIKRKLAI